MAPPRREVADSPFPPLRLRLHAQQVRTGQRSVLNKSQISFKGAVCRIQGAEMEYNSHNHVFIRVQSPEAEKHCVFVSLG